MTKVCRTCSRSLPPSDFWKEGKNPDGLAKDCIECSKKRWRERITDKQRVKYRERQRKFDDLNIARYLLRNARRRAKEKGLECTIRPSDIQVVDRCPILDVPLVKNQGQWQNNSYSLDRIDSTRGYVPGNVAVISWWANYLKSNLSVDQVERLLEYMRSNK